LPATYFSGDVKYTKRYQLGQHPQVGSLTFQLMDKVEDVPGTPAQPVQLHDRERISRLDELQDGGEFTAAITGAARYLLHPNYCATGGLDPIHLSIGRLAGAGDPGVSDRR
jgi:hypothetical protein